MSKTFGSYTIEPINTNIKCIIFSIIMCISYWFLPCDRNVYLLPLIFVISYVSMGWYDKLYNCEDRLLTGSGLNFGIIDSIFKPQSLKETELSPEEIEKIIPDQEIQRRLYLRNVYLFHLIAVVPLLLYIGYRGQKSDPRSFGALLGIAVLAGLYHFFRLVSPRI